jgi:hypothetical protein
MESVILVSMQVKKVYFWGGMAAWMCCTDDVSVDDNLLSDVAVKEGLLTLLI